MSVINTNVSAIAAQNSLRTSSLNQQQAMERLSSGLRINNAKDDAAGLAISTRMTANIRGMAAAIRNANDGISLTQTAEGALASIQDSLQRIRELAVQSANSTNSDSDRTSLDLEAQALITEINRVANVTSFNGINLLDGSYSDQSFQIGSGDSGDDRFSISIDDARISALGATETVDAVEAADATNEVAVVTFVDLADGETFTVGGLTYTAGENISAADLAAAFANSDNWVVGTQGDEFDGELTGWTAEANGSDVTFTSETAGVVDDLEALSGLVAAEVETTQGSAAVEAAPASVQVIDGQTLEDIDLTTILGSQTALGIVDGAINLITDSRASMGAYQNRFAAVITNLSNSTMNLQASRSRILDTDYAQETTNLAKAQIIQQAATAMLAQANQSQQSVLALLK